MKRFSLLLVLVCLGCSGGPTVFRDYPPVALASLKSERDSALLDTKLMEASKRARQAMKLENFEAALSELDLIQPALKEGEKMPPWFLELRGECLLRLNKPAEAWSEMKSWPDGLRKSDNLTWTLARALNNDLTNEEVNQLLHPYYTALEAADKAWLQALKKKHPAIRDSGKSYPLATDRNSRLAAIYDLRGRRAATKADAEREWRAALALVPDHPFVSYELASMIGRPDHHSDTLALYRNAAALPGARGFEAQRIASLWD
jgi:predicted Zn-dependent protease